MLAAELSSSEGHSLWLNVWEASGLDIWTLRCSWDGHRVREISLTHSLTGQRNVSTENEIVEREWSCPGLVQLYVGNTEEESLRQQGKLTWMV
jgi:hypothetical protein